MGAFLGKEKGLVRYTLYVHTRNTQRVVTGIAVSVTSIFALYNKFIYSQPPNRTLLRFETTTR
jgi:hypothetical protein